MEGRNCARSFRIVFTTEIIPAKSSEWYGEVLKLFKVPPVREERTGSIYRVKYMHPTINRTTLAHPRCSPGYYLW